MKISLPGFLCYQNRVQVCWH